MWGETEKLVVHTQLCSAAVKGSKAYALWVFDSHSMLAQKTTTQRSVVTLLLHLHIFYRTMTLYLSLAFLPLLKTNCRGHYSKVNSVFLETSVLTSEKCFSTFVVIFKWMSGMVWHSTASAVTGHEDTVLAILTIFYTAYLTGSLECVVAT